MWAALITAVANVFTGINSGAQGQYAQQRAEYEHSLAFSEAKDMAFYSAYQRSSSQVITIAVFGFLFLALIIWLLLR